MTFFVGLFQVPKVPSHRESDNALALLCDLNLKIYKLSSFSCTLCRKLVDSDFEDMQLVKSAMKRIKVA